MTKRRNTHFRELRNFAFQEHVVPEDFETFFENEILPAITIAGYKRSDKERLAKHCVHQLVLTGLVGACVSDTRDTGKRDKSLRQRIQVWDAIIDAGFAMVCKGSESSGMVTRYRATTALLDIRKCWELNQLQNLLLNRNTQTNDPTKHALIYLHSGKWDRETGKLLDPENRKQLVSIREEITKRAQPNADGNPDPEAIKNGLQHFEAMEDLIERINRSNTEHSWQAFSIDEAGKRRVHPANPCLRQVHVGKFFRAARLYTYGELSAQNLPKDARREMLIGGEPTAELDFAGMATRMLYHRKGIDAKGDVYRPEEVFPKLHGFDNLTAAKRRLIRDFIKRATNICWNTSTHGAASSAVSKLVREHPKRKYLERVIYQVEDTEPAGIVARLLDVHEPLKEFFFSGIGAELMTTDGRIMLRILTAFADAGKPALGLHDAVVCRASDAAFADETMREAYYLHVRFQPVISRVY